MIPEHGLISEVVEYVLGKFYFKIFIVESESKIQIRYPNSLKYLT